ncbi:MAG: DegT/DnrJ/EryC1/StrS family aminotransferase [Gammaproteobacteria bacterium]|nr:DegT/DnrJ/EryC1/StrS family aminotransferase [Gammaproteobacteria bacterium]
MQFIDLKKQYERMEEKIQHRIQTVLAHGQYIMGPEVKELEEKLARFVGVKHAIANASGTDALLMALMSLDIKPGDEVITSAFSFFATAEVILLCHAVPVFVDIDPLTYNLSPEQVKKAITAKTKAIMPVSLYGQCADMDAINQIAADHQLAVIEDAAQSFGAVYQGRRSGALSTIACTSFFPSKPLGAYGDAGACFTDDDYLAERLREIRVHGQSARYVHRTLGFTGRIDTLQAAILLEKLDYFEEETEMRQQVATRYASLLDGIVKTPHIMPGHTCIFAQYTIEVSHRDEFQRNMQQRGIPTAVHYPSLLHEQEALKDIPQRRVDFPVAKRASQRVVSLPMHPYLTQSEQEQIATAVAESIHCVTESA